MNKFTHLLHDHPLILHGEDDFIPDEWYSRSCNGCGWPIFSTPSYTCSRECSFFLHRRCAHLPQQLKHSTHEGQPLTLCEVNLESSHRRCRYCKFEVDNFIYDCPLSWECLSHLSCAHPPGTTVSHRSHEHGLIPLRGEPLLLCGACGIEHKGQFYCCNSCGYWIHHDCASLPHAIQYKNHHAGLHTLIIAYSLPYDGGRQYWCAICEKLITEGLGIYFCSVCRYYAHLKCATADTDLYKPVSSREIELDPNVVRLPMKDEDTSLMRYLLEHTSYDTEELNISEVSHSQKGFEHVHQHPLIFHHHFDDDHRGLSLVCDGCIEPISSSYYSCSRSLECPNFFLHSHCANLPLTITHPAHEEHPLDFLNRPPGSAILPRFPCKCCRSRSNGFAYWCKECDFFLDIVCAFLPGSAAHEAHGRRHILLLQYCSDYTYNSKCCVPNFSWTYRCSICRHYQVHGDCALLPTTVHHKYDRHPLKLVTSSDEKHDPEHFCEICEKSIHDSNFEDIIYWYYHCEECDQSFHTRCIPSVSPNLAKIKLGGTVHVDPSCHPCPLTSIRMITIPSCICGYCGEMIQGLEDKIAFKCSKSCSYTIHYYCAKKHVEDESGDDSENELEDELGDDSEDESENSQEDKS